MIAHFPPLLPTVRFLGAGAIALAAAGAEHNVVKVDQPDRWYDPSASHHAEHAAGGAVIGAATFEGAAVVTDDRAKRYASAIVAGLVIGIAYEVAEGRDGRSYTDPLDAAWTGVGAAVGAAAADLTESAITATVHRDAVGIGLAFRF